MKSMKLKKIYQLLNYRMMHAFKSVRLGSKILIYNGRPSPEDNVIFFSAQPSRISVLFHISQDFIGQLTRMSKFSQ